MITIRGAITVESNTEEDILNGTIVLLEEIESKNSINQELVISIIFSVTEDLDKVAPAKGARQMGYTSAGLMCFNEMNVENGLKKCIRLIMFYNSKQDQKSVKHVYLRKAAKLRPDLQVD